MTGEPRPLMLWSGTVRGAGFAELLDAAVAGSFSWVSLFPTDYRRARRSGYSAADMRALMRDRGVRVAALDPYSRWLPDWRPPERIDRERLALLDMDEQELFAAAEALGVGSVSVVEPFGATYPREQLAECFAAVCDRAAESGLKVQLEFIPFTGIRSLAEAWEIVRLAGRSNGGLVFDYWHHVRGDGDDELLRRIPGNRIFAVQACDGAAEPIGSLVEDSLRHRRPPGEGDWDLVGLTELLLRKPDVGTFGVEVFSEALWRLAPREIGRRSGKALRGLLARAGGAP